MALRIHFSSADLARVRVASAPDPLWESLLSAYRLGQGRGMPAFERWRQETRARLIPEVRPFLQLVPRAGYAPDFLTPGLTSELSSAMEAVLATPRRRLRVDMARLAEERKLPVTAVDVGSGTPRALEDLGKALRTYHDLVVAPLWPVIEAEVRMERNRLARLMLDGGIERVFASLRVDSQWEPDVLTMLNHPADRDLHLDGRGLVLLPSYFCWKRPVTLRDPEHPPVLVYPIERGIDAPPAVPAGSAVESSLASLIGRTRAAVLHALAESPATTTTTELAGRLSISLASASEHVSVLRAAALTSSRRAGKAVHHSLTPLGRDLVVRSIQ